MAQSIVLRSTQTKTVPRISNARVAGFVRPANPVAPTVQEMLSGLIYDVPGPSTLDVTYPPVSELLAACDADVGDVLELHGYNTLDGIVRVEQVNGYSSAAGNIFILGAPGYRRHYIRFTSTTTATVYET